MRAFGAGVSSAGIVCITPQPGTHVLQQSRCLSILDLLLGDDRSPFKTRLVGHGDCQRPSNVTQITGLMLHGTQFVQLQLQ